MNNLFLLRPFLISRGNSRGHFWRKNLQDFFYTKKSLFPSKSIQNRIIFVSSQPGSRLGLQSWEKWKEGRSRGRPQNKKYGACQFGSFLRRATSPLSLPALPYFVLTYRYQVERCAGPVEVQRATEWAQPSWWASGDSISKTGEQSSLMESISIGIQERSSFINLYTIV